MQVLAAALKTLGVEVGDRVVGMSWSIEFALSNFRGFVILSVCTSDCLHELKGCTLKPPFAHLTFLIHMYLLTHYN